MLELRTPNGILIGLIDLKSQTIHVKSKKKDEVISLSWFLDEVKKAINENL